MANLLKIRWADANVRTFGKRIHLLNERFPKVLPRIVNQVGNRAKTQVIRNLTKQTGLPRKTIVKAVGDPTKASRGRLSYDMVTRGGNIRLKYLGPKEVDGGVWANAFGKKTFYPGAFMTGGQWPNRREVSKWNGHVMVRAGSGWGGRSDGSRGKKVTYARSGVVIPVEMTSGATKAAFNRIAGPLLRQRVEAALDKLAP
ncbi:hypothetical protein [Rhizobium halophytocola]|uniref:HK97 gp10 family phage protein n=1 Tax=Rhizobium halophytocola TaxID=735519 RepID=A0ABS4E2G6_9HYPH|nr:hypothetical protein [Rhizobium halophytocola]MBP1852132.1 hypothetical protein [Rhizobium halophytocola]